MLRCRPKVEKIYPSTYGKKKPWFDEFFADLGKKMRDALRSFRESTTLQDRNRYTLMRTAYHKATRNAESQIKVQEVERLVESTKQRGISALYKHARVASDIATSLPRFLDYCKTLFILPCVPVLLKIFDPEDHSLLQPVTEEEVDASLSHQKSTAPSTFGVSPADIKIVKDKLISPLASVYSWCLENATFPQEWLESSLFFSHKKGDRSNPSNFRTINVQNPKQWSYVIFSGKINDLIFIFIIGCCHSFIFDGKCSRSNV